MFVPEVAKNNNSQAVYSEPWANIFSMSNRFYCRQTDSKNILHVHVQTSLNTHVYLTKNACTETKSSSAQVIPSRHCEARTAQSAHNVEQDTFATKKLQETKHNRKMVQWFINCFYRTVLTLNHMPNGRLFLNEHPPPNQLSRSTQQKWKFLIKQSHQRHCYPC